MLHQVSVIVPLAPADSAQQPLLRSFECSPLELIVSRGSGRAQSLNSGAASSRGRWLWFVHADSVLPENWQEALGQALTSRPEHLHYFNLAFDRGLRLKLNAGLANLRSHWFALPYGDQGLCLSRQWFDQLGGFPEDTEFGEDLLLVRRARKAGIRLNPVPATITTSGRKYRQQGWLNTSLRHQLQLWRLLRRAL